MDGKKDFLTVGSRERGYLFEFKPDGVFLTVYPTGRNTEGFELSDMRQILKDYDVQHYDIELLARIVRESSGIPQKIADSFQLPQEGMGYPPGEEDGEDFDLGRRATFENIELDEADERPFARMTIQISRDRMTATVHRDWQGDCKRPTAEMVMKELQDKNIVYGIDLEAIEDGVVRDEDFVAAKGDPAINGENAKIVRNFDMGIKGKPVANKYDQVDYKNLNIFLRANKGDVLAERVPQTEGTAGKNIFGETVPPRPGRPVPLPVGKNTEAMDENYIIATISGQIVDTGTKISVDPQLVINSDVGVPTGNIDFDGAVIIKGSVQDGFAVKAVGDIEIKGMVSGGEVEGRNVYVSGGILGMRRGKIRAKGDVRAYFLENADVQAERNVYVSDVVLHSNVQAGNKLIVDGVRGLVAGGKLAAGEEIRAKVIGNQMNVMTRLSVGVNPMLRQRYQQACVEYKESKNRLDQVTKTLNTLEKIDISRLPPERVQQIKQLTVSQFPLAGKVERNKKLIIQLDEEMQKMRKGRIRVADTIYPGVKMSVNTVLKNLYTEERHCSFFVEGNDVQMGAY